MGLFDAFGKLIPKGEFLPWDPRWNLLSAAAGPGTVFALMIGAMFAFVIGYDLYLLVRARRLLRQGTQAQARIESLEPTGGSTNNVPDYRLRACSMTTQVSWLEVNDGLPKKQ